MRKKGIRNSSACVAINMKEDSKIFWKFIQSKTKTKENSPCIIDEQGEINTDDRIKAELMNNFVQSVFTVEVDSQNAPTLDQRTDEKLSTIKFIPETVQNNLEKLKVPKSSGPDQMHTQFLHETAKNISIPLRGGFRGGRARRAPPPPPPPPPKIRKAYVIQR